MRFRFLYDPQYGTGHFMRLLIYLLAMMTGFSAAEAARPVSATPAALGAAVMHEDAIAASVAAIRNETASAQITDGFALRELSVVPVATALQLAPASPVIRHDITRE